MVYLMKYESVLPIIAGKAKMMQSKINEEHREVKNDKPGASG